MIELTRLNYVTIFLNSDLIESITGAPDTIVCLRNGSRMVVREGASEILEKIGCRRYSILQYPGALRLA